MTDQQTIIRRLLESAVAQKASDIHLRRGVGVFFRLNGDLMQQVGELFNDPSALCDACISLADENDEALVPGCVSAIDPSCLPDGLRFAKVVATPGKDGQTIVLRLGSR